MRQNNKGLLIKSLLIPLLGEATLFISSVIGVTVYDGVIKPALSPPVWVFWIAGLILYLCMGLSSYLILMSDINTRKKEKAINTYSMLVAMNIVWPVIFFTWANYMVSFIWLMVMCCVLIFCVYKFFNINKVAACIFIPYIIWIMYVEYLNFGICKLNIDVVVVFLKGVVV